MIFKEVSGNVRKKNPGVYMKTSPALSLIVSAHLGAAQCPWRVPRVFPVPASAHASCCFEQPPRSLLATSSSGVSWCFWRWTPGCRCRTCPWNRLFIFVCNICRVLGGQLYHFGDLLFIHSSTNATDDHKYSLLPSADFDSSTVLVSFSAFIFS